MTRRSGIALALAAACISGVSVFVNSYGVKEYRDATAYTTAKNMVAALVVLVLMAAAGWRHRTGRAGHPPLAPVGRAGIAGVIAIAVIGGSVPFVLFFEGLARASAKDAAFLHKTLVVWVAILAVVFLRERIGWLQVGAIAALVAGQALLGIRLDALRPGTGELMILTATLFWAVEVVIAKWLMARLPATTLAAARMAGGVVLLVAWLAITGRFTDLVPRTPTAWLWVLVTGALLGCYVSLWYAALSRASAVDVTAVLVFAVAVTALLDAIVKDAALVPQLAGLALVASGTTIVIAAALKRTASAGHAVPAAAAGTGGAGVAPPSGPASGPA